MKNPFGNLESTQVAGLVLLGGYFLFQYFQKQKQAITLAPNIDIPEITKAVVPTQFAPENYSPIPQIKELPNDLNNYVSPTNVELNEAKYVEVAPTPAPPAPVTYYPPPQVIYFNSPTSSSYIPPRGNTVTISLRGMSRFV